MPTDWEKICRILIGYFPISMTFSYQRISNDPYGTHQKILNWIPAGKLVLEIGCANGYISQKIAEKGSRVVAVEIDHRSAGRAVAYCKKIIVGDIENSAVTAKLNNYQFDVIVLADVLEHLRKPDSTLQNLLLLLKKNGLVLISIPNIAFVTNRLKLVLGIFEYTKWGIMDRTHLRFFTRSSIERLMQQAGLIVSEFDFVGNFSQLPLFMQLFYPFLGKKVWWRKLEYKITGLWPQGLALQFLFLCRKK